MSTTPVGAACPFCHFTVKTGAAVHACPSCGAVHHEECWVENGGCAVTGCAAAPGTGPGAAAAYAPPTGSDAPTDPHGQPAAAPAPDPPPADAPTAVAPRQPRPAGGGPGWPATPPPAPTGGGDGRGRWIAIGAIVPTVLVVAGLGGYLIANGGGDDPPKERPATTATKDGSATTTGGDGPSTTGTTTPAGGDGGERPAGGGSQRQAAARQMVEAMNLSAEGRRLSAARDLAGARANRERVLARLGRITPGSDRQAQALDAFRRAIVASRDAIHERQVNPSAGANAYDIQATRAKQEFCRLWGAAGLSQLTSHGCDPNAI
ncbi:RING finger protein [Patulibacter defluvii]|uniref:RING finger protein n=1 Tax=Patulibacter defluvii TaxID=3095358 RepID=UPI002A75714F|nr:RING finger protein [Patulibacter sp. DM4]